MAGPLTKRPMPPYGGLGPPIGGPRCFGKTLPIAIRHPVATLVMTSCLLRIAALISSIQNCDYLILATLIYRHETPHRRQRGFYRLGRDSKYHPRYRGQYRLLSCIRDFLGLPRRVVANGRVERSCCTPSRYWSRRRASLTGGSSTAVSPAISSSESRRSAP